MGVVLCENWEALSVRTAQAGHETRERCQRQMPRGLTMGKISHHLQDVVCAQNCLILIQTSSEH